MGWYLAWALAQAAEHAPLPAGVQAEAAAHLMQVLEAVIGAGKAGPVTQKLQKAFFDVVTGKDRKRRHWLTPVPMKKGGK